MADRDEILAFASDLLDLDAYPDYGPMGLQVAGARDVRRLACGVSSSLELFERAAAADAQMLLVHHGVLWDRDPRVIDDAARRRLKTLFAEYEGSRYRVMRENAEIVAFQREGAGLPYGGVRK